MCKGTEGCIGTWRDVERHRGGMERHSETQRCLDGHRGVQKGTHRHRRGTWRAQRSAKEEVHRGVEEVAEEHREV